MPKLIMFSKDNCPKCQEAITYLNNKELEYDLLKIGNDITLDCFRTLFPEVKSVPFFILAHTLKFNSLNSLKKELEYQDE